MFWFTFQLFGKESIQASTEIEKSEICYRWTIHNYKLNGKLNGEYLMSPQFSSRNDNLQWCMKLYPNGVDIQSENAVSLYIHLRNVNPGMKVHARGVVHVLNQAKAILNKPFYYEFDEIFEKSDSHWGNGFGWNIFEGKYNFYHFYGLLTDDNLTIECNMEYSISRQGSTSQTKEITSFHEQFNIHDDLGSLLESKEFFDVTLMASDGELRAHKAILAARSSVFSTLLEKEGDRIEMSDFDSDIVKDMLQYVYVGKVNNFFKNPDRLLEIANKYDIKGLKALCKDLIYDELTFSNSIEFLILADAHNCHMLKKKIIRFMITHNGNIKNLPNFETCKNSHPQLIIEVLSAMSE